MNKQEKQIIKHKLEDNPVLSKYDVVGKSLLVHWCCLERMVKLTLNRGGIHDTLYYCPLCEDIKHTIRHELTIPPYLN